MDSAELFYNEAYYITRTIKGDEIEVMKIRNRLGYINYLKQDYEHSILFFNQSLSLDSLSLLSNFYMGKISKKKKKYHKALNYFNIVVKTDDKYDYVLNEIGETYFSLNNFDSAKYFFEESIKSDTSFYKSYLNLGDIYLLEKEYIISETYYLKALRLNNNKNVRSSLTNLYELTGNRRKKRLINKKEN